jgi:hypothetical protein
MEPGPPSPPPSLKIDLFYKLVKIFISKILDGEMGVLRASYLHVHTFITLKEKFGAVHNTTPRSKTDTIQDCSRNIDR